jgi:hypothetical protein
MDSALAAWLTPSGLAVVSGAVAWLVKAVVAQDRRIEQQAASIRECHGQFERYATREACGAKHAEVASRAAVSDAFEQLRALERLQAEDRAAVKVALERFSAAVDRLDRIEERLSRYFEDSTPRTHR